MKQLHPRRNRRGLKLMTPVEEAGHPWESDLAADDAVPSDTLRDEPARFSAVRLLPALRSSRGGAPVAKPRPLGDMALTWLLPVLLLAGWEAASRLGYLAPRILPAPSAVVLAFRENLQNGALIHHTLISIQRALVGLVIGGGLGFMLGIVNSAAAIGGKRTGLTPRMLRAMPHLAVIPLVILWFGRDESAALFLISAGVFFPVYLNTRNGIRSVDRGLIEMGRVCGLSTGALYARIILPGALPSILAGLRYALGVMWLALIVAETVSAKWGIGSMIKNAGAAAQTDVVLLGILDFALLAALADMAVRWIERRALAWHPSTQTGFEVAR
ncbi:MAG TPA: ABC transporter permease subunit [Candidatus Cybelea sp.]|nr:ABC transporter permease subunit [Candidatus Cybelea sp.]